MKLTNSYESLALQTREAFPHLLDKVRPIKFYYLDDENELVSISSQNDFAEALSIDGMHYLKLTIASSAAEARISLEKQIQESFALD